MLDTIFTLIYLLLICLIVYETFKISTMYPQIKAIDKKNNIKKKKRRRATTPPRKSKLIKHLK